MANLKLRHDNDAGPPSEPRTPSLLPGWDPFRLMDSLLRWDPFRELGLMARTAGGGAFLPAFEVREQKNGYVIQADLPGVKESDLDISLQGNMLTVSGKREAEGQDEAQGYYCCERSYGTFTRSFTLPTGVDTEHVQADLKDGVLRVVLPKRPEAQPRRIALGGATDTTKQIGS